MLLDEVYGSNGGLDRLTATHQRRSIEEALSLPELPVVRGASGAIKQHIESMLESRGWSINQRLDRELGAAINGVHHTGIALQVQLGNVSRAFYDLMKLEYLVNAGFANVGVLIVPSKSAARRMGDNLANFDRVTSEHTHLFREIVRLPLAIFSFN